MRRFTLSLLALALASSAARADAPKLVLHQQGRLLDANDAPVQGAVTLGVRLYAKRAPDGDAADKPVWEDSFPVTLFNGSYTLALGTGAKALTSAEFPAAEERWMELVVNGTALQPRLRVGAVPLAIDARNLGGRPASDYALGADLADGLDGLRGGAAGSVSLKSLSDGITAANAAIADQATAQTAALADQATAQSAALASQATAQTAALAAAVGGANTATTNLKTLADGQKTTADTVTAIVGGANLGTVNLKSLDSRLGALEGAAMGQAGGTFTGDIGVGDNQYVGIGWTDTAIVARDADSQNAMKGALVDDTTASTRKATKGTVAGGSGRIFAHSKARAGGSYDVSFRLKTSAVTSSATTLANAKLGTISVNYTIDGTTWIIAATQDLYPNHFSQANQWQTFRLHAEVPGNAQRVGESVTYSAASGPELSADYARAQVALEDDPTTLRGTVPAFLLGGWNYQAALQNLNPYVNDSGAITGKMFFTQGGSFNMDASAPTWAINTTGQIYFGPIIFFLKSPIAQTLQVKAYVDDVNTPVYVYQPGSSTPFSSDVYPGGNGTTTAYPIHVPAGRFAMVWNATSQNGPSMGFRVYSQFVNENGLTVDWDTIQHKNGQ